GHSPGAARLATRSSAIAGSAVDPPTTNMATRTTANGLRRRSSHGRPNGKPGNDMINRTAVPNTNDQAALGTQMTNADLPANRLEYSVDEAARTTGLPRPALRADASRQAGLPQGGPQAHHHPPAPGSLPQQRPTP